MSDDARQLRFHRQVYDGNSVDAAIQAFGGHANFERSEDSDYWIVTVAAHKAGASRALVGEFANYALGLTIEAERA